MGTLLQHHLWAAQLQGFPQQAGNMCPASCFEYPGVCRRSWDLVCPHPNSCCAQHQHCRLCRLEHHPGVGTRAPVTVAGKSTTALGLLGGRSCSSSPWWLHPQWTTNAPAGSQKSHLLAAASPFGAPLDWQRWHWGGYQTGAVAGAPTAHARRSFPQLQAGQARIPLQ